MEFHLRAAFWAVPLGPTNRKTFKPIKRVHTRSERSFRSGNAHTVLDFTPQDGKKQPVSARQYVRRSTLVKKREIETEYRSQGRQWAKVQKGIAPPPASVSPRPDPHAFEVLETRHVACVTLDY